MFVLALAASLAATQPGDVVDPRPAHHVLDLTGTLSAADIAEIDQHAAGAAAGGELLVVVVPTTSRLLPRAWTMSVFNRWSVDSRERNRGVILMAAIDDRKAEIVVGDGFPVGIESSTDAIMQNVVVRNFKAGNARAALVEGARALVDDVILFAVPAAAPEPVVIAPEVIAASTMPAVAKIPDPRAHGGVVDVAKVLTKSDKQRLATARVLTAPTATLFVFVKDGRGANTGPRAASEHVVSAELFVAGLAHRLQLDEPDNKDLLVIVFTDLKKAKDAGAAPHDVAIVAGRGLPSEAMGPFIDSAEDAWRRWMVSRPKALTIGAVTADMATKELAFLQGHLEKHEREQRLRAEQEAQREVERRERAAAAAMAVPQYDDSSSGGELLTSDNPVTWAGGAGGIAGLLLVGREIARRRPRSCKRCRVRMHRLGEEADDKHLAAGEIAEERLKSVDYDVWACAQCGSVLKTRWGAIFSSYSRCNGCSWKTMSTSSRTITAATTSSTGLAEVTERCTHCSHHRTYTRVIPRVQKSSSSSSSGGRSSGGGGGFSSGRGSSGSW